jgi:hypothetical protein
MEINPSEIQKEKIEEKRLNRESTLIQISQVEVYFLYFARFDYVKR